MNPKLKDILKKNYVEGVFHTHVSLLKPKGKYQFNKQHLEEFWQLYCEEIEDEKSPLGIAEKSQEYLPVLADIDLRIIDDGRDDISTPLYTEKQLETVVSTYQSVLRKIIDNCSDTDLTCVVLEKKMYQTTKNGITYFKNGFHLHFPYVFLNKESQEIHLIPRVQEEIGKLNLFSNVTEDSATVVDKVCCRVPWLLYGSKKSEDSTPYKVTKIYDSTLKKISMEKAFEKYQIYDNRDKPISISGKIEKYLPRILSILPFNRPTKEIKKGVVSVLKEKMKKDKKSSMEPDKKMNVEENLALARKLLPLLADYRASERNEWMSIGWILFNISEGHPEGLDLWCDFSSRCEEKYDEDSCIYQWERMVKKDYTMGTLRHFAKMDNPVEYKKIKEERSNKYILSSIEGSHHDVARALYEEFGDEFVCGTIQNKIWFQFKNHIWEQIEEGVYLRNKISDKIVDRYQQARKKLYEEIADCRDDKGTEAMLTARVKQVNRLIAQLKNNGFKNAVMKEAGDVFYDERFREKLDANPFLICFKNGVYDLQINEFRAGRPEDFLSKSLPINYNSNFTESSPEVCEVLTFLEQVFPDKSILKYFLDVSSEIFTGGNHAKHVHFWTGVGDNGKSVTQKLFEKMLGKFAIKMPTSCLTGKKPQTGSANPELARAGGGVRLTVFEEPDADECINSGTMKHWSGNDSFYARDLFEKGKDGREIEPLFKMVFICNKLPKIRNPDQATWNRIRVIPFESCFWDPTKHDVPETTEEQIRQKIFPRDNNFGVRIPGLLEPLAWLLLNHRKKIAHEPRIEPEKVLIATQIYQKQNDIYRQFLEENIVEDKEKVISLTDIFAIFKEWFREGFPNHSAPVKNELEDYLIKYWGISMAGKKWKGYRRRVQQDEIDSGDVIVLNEEDLVNYSEDTKINPLLN